MSETERDPVREDPIERPSSDGTATQKSASGESPAEGSRSERPPSDKSTVEEFSDVVVEGTTELERTAPASPYQPDGSVVGYRPDRAMPVAVEMGRQIGRRRTKLALGFLAVLPLLLYAAFELGNPARPGMRGAIELATVSGLSFAVFTVLASTNFLLVAVTALFFGDTVASERSWSSLKYLLAAPVSRARLLRQKAIVAAVLSGLCLFVLPAVALIIGVFGYGAGSLVNDAGETLSFANALVCLFGACVYLAIHLSWVAALALWLSVSTDAPLGAVGGTVLVSIVCQILDEVSALEGIQEFLPTHYSQAWVDLFSEEIDWTGMVNGMFSALVYATLFGALALRRFRRQDIAS